MKIFIVMFFCVNFSLSILAQNNGQYYGFLNAHKLVVKSFNGQIYSNNAVDATFSDIPMGYISPLHGAKGGNIKFNNKKIKFEDNDHCPSNNHDGYYTSEQNDNINFNNQEWKISGHAIIPNFTFNNPKPFPSFTVINNIPDTISKQDTLIISFYNVQDADSISIYIRDGVGNNAKNIQVITTSALSEFYLTPAMLTNLGLSNEALVSLCAINYTTIKVNDKKFLFKNQYEYFKAKVNIIN